MIVWRTNAQWVPTYVLSVLLTAKTRVDWLLVALFCTVLADGSAYIPPVSPS